MGNHEPIGVFDSGIGGLTVVKELRELLPEEDIIYFGDTARTPYGSRPPAQIVEFMHEILRFFAASQVKMAIIACNTMTTLGIDEARKYPFHVLGVNNGAKYALEVSKTKKIGIMATEATINSGKHAQAIKGIDPQASVFPMACPKLVPLIENEQIADSNIEQAALEYVPSLQQNGVDTIILGCTHYPFISPLLTKLASSTITFVDPARETAKAAKNLLAAEQLNNVSHQGSCELYFSAHLQRAERMARYILNDNISKIGLINLQDFA